MGETPRGHPSAQASGKPRQPPPSDWRRAGWARELVARRADSWLVRGVLVVVAIGLLTLVYHRLSQTSAITSDDSVFVLQGQALVQGNLLLHGWTIPDDNFLTSDLPLYALVVALRGVSPGVVHLVGGLVYALIVVAATLLARGERGYSGAWLRMLVTFGLLAAPAAGLGVARLLTAPYHTGSTLFLLAAVLALAWSRCRWPGLIAFGVLLALDVAANPLSLYVGVGAVAAVSAIRLLTGPTQTWRDDATLLVVSLAAAGAGLGLRHAEGALGGFNDQTVAAGFAQLATVPRNVQLGIEGWLTLFGADPFGQPVSRHLAVPMLRLIGYGLVLVAGAAVIVRWLRGREGDRINQILVAIMAFDALSFVLGTTTIDIQSTRYLAPLVGAGAALAGRLTTTLLATRRLQVVATALAVLYIALLPLALRTPPAVQPQQQLAAWLEQEHLDYGLGAYWDSNVVTVTSNDRVRVRGVLSDGRRIHPYLWEADRAWYDPGRHDARFLVFDSGSNYQQVSATTAVATFGQPAQVHQVGTYTVMVWHKNLLPDMMS